MRIIGGLFDEDEDLTIVLQDLRDAGYVTFNVFGPAELYRSLEAEAEIEAMLESQRHTAGGAVEGITFHRRPLSTEDPSAQTVADDLRTLGIPEEEAELFVAGLRLDQYLLLLQTKAGRADDAEAIMEEGGAVLVRTIFPSGASPEERR